MTRDEVRNLMHDYFDDLLSAEERSTVESYLEEYEDVANEFELLNKLLEKAESLPIGIKPQDGIVKKISDELLSESIAKVESDKQKRLREITESSDGRKKKKKSKTKKSDHSKAFKTNKLFPKKPLIIFGIIALLVGGYFVYDYLVTNFPWQIKPVYGEYQVNGKYTKTKTLDSEDNLSTFDSSKVSVVIPNAGKIDLNSFTMMKVIQGKDRNNIVSLQSGSIDADLKIDDPRLTIRTSAVRINSIGGEYSVTVNEVSGVSVQTANGVVKLISEPEELLLIQDHMCKILGNGNIGIPYHINAEPEFVELLSEISFGNAVSVNYEPLLELTSPQDGITLLHLLIEAKNPADRLAIFIKLNEFYPVPPGVTQPGVLNKNEEMLTKWREEIEWQI